MLLTAICIKRATKKYNGFKKIVCTK